MNGSSSSRLPAEAGPEDAEAGDQARRNYFGYYSEFDTGHVQTALEVAVLAVSFVVSVLANLDVGLCVLRHKDMRASPMNLYLVNMALADLLFALGVPAIAYTRLTHSWRLGPTLCRLLPYSQFVCGFVLLWTLSLISMDRHRCLAVPPYRSALTLARVLGTSLLTWLIAAVLFLPAALYFRPLRVSAGASLQKGQIICTLVLPDEATVPPGDGAQQLWALMRTSRHLTVPALLVACLLPMALVVYYYQRIFQRIIDTKSRWAVPCVLQGVEPSAAGAATTSEPGAAAAGGRRRDSELSVVGSLVPWGARKLSTVSASFSQHEEVRVAKHLRVARLLLLNIAAVLTMWLPITLTMLLLYLDEDRPPGDPDRLLRSRHFVWALIVAELNTAVNPLLYGFLSGNFRGRFCLSLSAGHQQHQQQQTPQPGNLEGNQTQEAGGRSATRSLEALHDCTVTTPTTSTAIVVGQVPSGAASTLSYSGSFRSRTRFLANNSAIPSIQEQPASERL